MSLTMPHLVGIDVWHLRGPSFHGSVPMRSVDPRFSLYLKQLSSLFLFLFAWVIECWSVVNAVVMCRRVSGIDAIGPARANRPGRRFISF